MNVYRYMLESEYSLSVAGMLLCVVHPSLAKGKVLEVPRMDDEVALIVRDQVSRGLARCAAAPGADAPFALP